MRFDKWAVEISDEDVAGILDGRRGCGRWAIAERYGLTNYAAEQIIRTVRAGSRVERDNGKLSGSKPLRVWTEKGDSAHLTFISSEPFTEDGVLEASGVDTTRWEADWMRLKSWDGQQKDPNGDPLVVRMHGAQITLRRKWAEPAIREIIADLTADLPAKRPPKRRHKAAPRASDRMMLLSFPDVHFGKAAPKWSIEEAERLFCEAADYFIGRVSAGNDLALTVIPIGNDVTHIDNALGTTTSGTKVESIASYQRQFKAAVRSYVYKIDLARELGPVRVVLVQGNHGWNTDFAIEQVLCAHYRLDDGVQFDTAYCDEYGHFGRAYVEFGMNLLGFTHKPQKGEKLSVSMAHEQPGAWARTAGGWREWHIGHHHHRELTKPGAYLEDDSVVYRMSPALCPQDMYHKVGMWFAMRGAECHVYERAGGRVEQYELPRSLIAA